MGSSCCPLTRLEAMLREWLLELRMRGRTPRAIDSYQQKLAWCLQTGQSETLGELTGFELKRYLGELRDRDLADNTIHRFFAVVRGWAGGADREVWWTAPSGMATWEGPGRT